MATDIICRRKRGELLNIPAPIGLDIGGESPEELGISIMAEIMAVRYGRTAMPLRDKKRIYESMM